MTLFSYPDTKHSRKHAPRVFKRYRTYRRFLQSEFERVCVYCRQPDSTSPNLNFGIDHYRPSSVPRFAVLVCNYANLFYCCNSCNSRKNCYWPFDEVSGPFVINPCDYEMASHLSFDPLSGKVVPITKNGVHTEDLLQLNEPTTVQFRLKTLLVARVLRMEIASTQTLIIEAHKQLDDELITLDEHGDIISILEQDIEEATQALLSFTGDLPLPAISKIKMKIDLTPS